MNSYYGKKNTWSIFRNKTRLEFKELLISESFKEIAGTIFIMNEITFFGDIPFVTKSIISQVRIICRTNSIDEYILFVHKNKKTGNSIEFYQIYLKWRNPFKKRTTRN